VGLPELPLDRLHLILEPQLQLLQTDFFQLLVFRKEALLGQRFKSL